MMRRISKQEFYGEVRLAAKETGSRYRGSQPAQAKLLRMAEANGWFQEDGSIFIEDEPEYSYRIKVWLASYGMGLEEKLVLLFDSGKGRYPETSAAYDSFFRKEKEVRVIDRLVIMDFVFSEITKEIMCYTEDELQPIITRTKEFLTTEQTKIFINSLYDMESRGLHLAYRYKPGAREEIHPENEAYSVYDYAKMAFYIFNEDAWKENRTVETAGHAKK